MLPGYDLNIVTIWLKKIFSILTVAQKGGNVIFDFYLRKRVGKQQIENERRLDDIVTEPIYHVPKAYTNVTNKVPVIGKYTEKSLLQSRSMPLIEASNVGGLSYDINKRRGPEGAQMTGSREGGNVTRYVSSGKNFAQTSRVKRSTSKKNRRETSVRKRKYKS